MNNEVFMFYKNRTDNVLSNEQLNEFLRTTKHQECPLCTGDMKSLPIECEYIELTNNTHVIVNIELVKGRMYPQRYVPHLSYIFKCQTPECNYASIDRPVYNGENTEYE